MTRLSRREFMRMVGITASAAVLGACTTRTPTEEVTEVEVTPAATPTPSPPTPTVVPPTATPTVVVEPGGFEMILVEAGSFQMGSASGASREQPVHTVNITRPFYMSKYEATFDQWDEFHEDTRPGSPLLDDGGSGRGDRPAGMIWYDAVEYCNWLSERAGLTPCFSGRLHNTKCDFSANGYRLPTEAEWEYAARGGTQSQGYIYAGSNDVDEVAWYIDNSGDQRHPVGQKAPNELGIYDMSGNVTEWCWDWYVRDYYASSPTDDPTGPDKVGTDFMDRMKVRRGGFWTEVPDGLRVAYRSFDGPDYRPGIGTGIRLVRTA